MERSLAYKRACLALAVAGKLGQPATEAERECVDETYDPNRLDAPLREAGSRLLGLPKVWQAMISEMASFVTVSDAPDAVTFSFGDKPLIVLSRGVDEGGPGVPPDALPRVEAAWRAGHAALAARSTRGEHIVVPNSRHYVQIDEPQAVIDAVRRVVLAVRKQ
jgi:pimeloyl-ACP methyl ester carboxylesterase